MELSGGRGRGMISPVITVSGDSEVLIENCRRFIECGEIKCSVLSARYLVEVWGSGLSASSYSNGSAAVRGRIQSVTIERRGRNDRKDRKGDEQR